MAVTNSSLAGEPDAWASEDVLERLKRALAKTPSASSSAKSKQEWHDTTSKDLGVLANGKHRKSLKDAPPALTDLLVEILSSDADPLAALAASCFVVLDAVLQELGGKGLAAHAAWASVVRAAMDALPAALERDVSRKRPRAALPVLDFAVRALEEPEGSLPRLRWKPLCNAMLRYVAVLQEVATSMENGDQGLWLLNTHARRIALDTLVVADASDIHDTLPLLLQTLDPLTETGAAARAQRELAGDSVAAILGQNRKERQLLGSETTSLLFVAMHLTAASHGKQNAWECWVLPSLTRLASGSEGKVEPHDLADAIQALGATAALCVSQDVARASGPAGLSALLNALEGVLQTASASEAHELAKCAGARAYRQLKAMQASTEHDPRNGKRENSIAG